MSLLDQWYLPTHSNGNDVDYEHFQTSFSFPSILCVNNKCASTNWIKLRRKGWNVIATVLRHSSTSAFKPLAAVLREFSSFIRTVRPHRNTRSFIIYQKFPVCVGKLQKTGSSETTESHILFLNHETSKNYDKFE